MPQSYEQPTFVSEAATAAAIDSGDRDRIVTAVIGAALAAPNRAFVEKTMLGLAKHKDPWVLKSIAMGASHLARIHRALDPKVKTLLKTLSQHPQIGEEVKEHLADVERFVKSRS
jgi:hypothetical protein